MSMVFGHHFSELEGYAQIVQAAVSDGSFLL
jgi:hypothetical protein